MIQFKRSDENPVLMPNPDNDWEGEASFNGCPIVVRGKVVLLYRAESLPMTIGDASRRISSIGYAESNDGLHFANRRQLIRPEFDWERFGCEDPRVTKLDGKYYVFYTALSQYPFRAEGIKVGLAITTDFKTIEKKHPVTTFNSKAMVLFPEKIDGKIAAVLTVNTDQPPAKIAIAIFDDESQIWSDKYWAEWYGALNNHIVSLERSVNDQIEVGAPPIKTKYGWLLLYSHIHNYLSPPVTFGVESAILNLNNPYELISRTKKPLLTPKEEYEKYGRVPNIIFPSGATVKGKELRLYYGAADTTCAVATIELEKNSLRKAGRSALIAFFIPSKTPPSTPSGLLEVFNKNGGIADMKTALLTRSEPYLLKYRATSPPPIENPTNVVSCRLSSVMILFRSSARVS